jgi:hypothetical protein
MARIERLMATGAWLQRHGGLSRANGDHLRAMILSRGRTEDPQLFQQFYGGPRPISARCCSTAALRQHRDIARAARLQARCSVRKLIA